MYERLPVFLAALWWGSLCSIGFVAVPMLFAHLPTPALAGFMAAKLFAAQTWISIACCALLLVFSKRKHAEKIEQWAQAAIGFVIAGMLLALLVQYGVSPKIVARENLRLWHSVGTGMYALQWLCAAIVLWRVAGTRKPA
ncbi:MULTISPECIES: DUF4149 domain-containing protein [Comamonas]|uniref:DUF4149 domain-containing protein n=1 Tax=Comamonas thiooxydans TaxID=363952 RepID=A0AA42TVV7_9BURK|nr:MULTISPECIES: DUF4149 domain-containing protein [Comamonas]BCX52348.1 hypothetical protein CTYAZ2_19300 [Comamonas testosteroni]KKI12046.1 hypothetical protein XA67_21840 [Comamonas thiooxydans]MDH1336469.1 DUF4149 domain-containing protein [Comamonas thiooxydans]MDH1742404.1 DUF4149 domain-containing protein [Comamonas thiooxydans]MDH1787527.1 DUF4149 domain-containing protein [Comamonas thiooxydans]